MTLTRTDKRRDKICYKYLNALFLLMFEVDYVGIFSAREQSFTNRLVEIVCDSEKKIINAGQF